MTQRLVLLFIGIPDSALFKWLCFNFLRSSNMRGNPGQENVII
jgi:hypothetical protein